ncbi:Transcription factor Sox-1b [Bienertia sinuspersici]
MEQESKLCHQKRGQVKVKIIGKLADIVKTEPSAAPPLNYCPRIMHNSGTNSGHGVATH